MAPERIDGNGEVNTKDDVWAFGMMALVRLNISPWT